MFLDYLRNTKIKLFNWDNIVSQRLPQHKLLKLIHRLCPKDVLIGHTGFGSGKMELRKPRLH